MYLDPQRWRVLAMRATIEEVSEWNIVYLLKGGC